MKAELKFLVSCDIDERVYWPENESNFSFTVDANIGPMNEDSGDIFQFHVCTSNWIFENMVNKDFGDHGVFGRYMIIVKDYDFDEIRNMISNLCKNTSGENWQEIAEKLSRYGEWEFSDYQT